MRETLRRKNGDLKHDLEGIAQIAARATIVAELEPYRASFLRRVERLLATARANLHLLSTGQDALLADVLSETSTLQQFVRIFKSRYLRALYRADDWDRVCLRTITWLHGEHEQTRNCPAVFADDDVSVIPSKEIPFYFFPCLEQRGLRFQALLFHEFGHVLYRCHDLEMNALVGQFQQSVEAELLPASQRNDQYAQEQARLRQSVVETWYKWLQEFFCDAVGLTIGGPAYLNAFSEYINRFQSTDYQREPADLHGSTHPVSWLRIQLLADRATAFGYSDAGRILGDWTGTAGLLRATEDYHGFYTAALRPALNQTLDDMLVEAAPYGCSPDQALGKAWESHPLNVVALLNRAWVQYFESPSSFQNWEAAALWEFYELQESPRD